MISIEGLGVVSGGGNSVVTTAGIIGLSRSIWDKVVAIEGLGLVAGGGTTVVKKPSELVEKFGFVGEKMAAVVIFVVDKVTKLVALLVLGFVELVVLVEEL